MTERAAKHGRTLKFGYRAHVIVRETEDEELWTEDGGDHEGWFCVRTDPFPCPASGCA